MIVRDNAKLRKGSAEFDVVVKQVLDLYIVTQNATACYNIYRRLIMGEDYKETASVRSTAAQFFKRDDNVDYMEIRAKELYRWGFDNYANLMELDVSKVIKEEKPRFSDVENLSPDELRTKNLTELEDIKNKTKEDTLKVQIIKQQTELMDAKRRERETSNTEKLIHMYLPMERCNNCKECEHTKGKELIK